MFEIVFLGTSASAPSIQRGLTSQAILAGEHRFLIDCGEGTQRQILRSGIGFKRLNRILLTHSHLDHILGLGGLMSTFARWESIDSVEIYGGKPTLARVYALLYGVVLDYERLDIKIDLKELKTGKFFESKDFTVSAFPVTHRGPGCFGFVFQEKSRRPFLVDKAEALGIPAGPERGRLVAGQTIMLADGRTITPEMVLGEEMRGVKLVYVGDVGRTDNIRDYVADADTLVIEATFLQGETEEAGHFGHLTARQAAELAAETGVKSLILNHVSRRYREAAVIEEARRYFPTTYVARDLDHYIVRRDQPLERLAPEVVRARAAQVERDELNEH
jgi:ribonuclease Z